MSHASGEPGVGAVIGEQVEKFFEHTPRFKNQDGIIKPDLLASKSFVVVGAGAIGSFFTMTLAKMGAREIVVYDDDRIANHNIANQMYPMLHVGRTKTDALADVVRSYSGETIHTIPHKWDGQVAEYVVSCVDSMAARSEIYAKAKAAGSIYLDGRMGAEVIRAYCIDTRSPEQCAFYERTLYTDAAAEEARCAVKSIIYTVLVVSGILLDMVRRQIVGAVNPQEVLCDLTMYRMEPTFVRPSVVPAESIPASDGDI